MYQLQREQYQLVQPLFAPLTDMHLSVAAVLAGTAPGEIHVDDPDAPCVGFALTPEGHYLVGDATQRSIYPALRELLPWQAYLTFAPVAWEATLPQIWQNPATRRHPRHHLRLAAPRLADWRARIPAGFRIVAIDRAFLAQSGLRNFEVVAERIEGWHSEEYFLEHGFGFCALEGDTIASNCIADCVVGERCEVGIGTESSYRRRGLAALVAAAAVEHCLARGITGIGWHCLQSNTGSVAVAQKVGFVHAGDYFAHSSILPAENATDMSVAEYEEWAAHYERFAVDHVRFSYDAARAWALAGDAERALAHLHRVFEHGWRGRPEWLARNWVFASLRGIPDFEAMIARLQQQADNEDLHHTSNA